MRSPYGIVCLLAASLGACQAHPHDGGAPTRVAADAAPMEVRNLQADASGGPEPVAVTVPSSGAAANALLGQEHAPDAHTGSTPSSAVELAAAQGGMRATRLVVERRLAHVMVAREDADGHIVTQCVTQLEHPLDVQPAIQPRAEVQ